MRDEPIMICNICGRGFLVNPGSKLDPVPVWFVGFDKDGPISGGTCGGLIVMRNRHAQIIKLEAEDGRTQDL